MVWVDFGCDICDFWVGGKWWNVQNYVGLSKSVSKCDFLLILSGEWCELPRKYENSLFCVNGRDMPVSMLWLVKNNVFYPPHL